MQNKLGIGSPVIGLCVGVLTGLGLASHGGVDMSSILIPYEALGIAILVMLFLLPILNGKKRKDQNRKDLKSLPNQSRHTTKTSDDPWEKEILRRSRMVKKNETRKLN